MSTSGVEVGEGQHPARIGSAPNNTYTLPAWGRGSSGEGGVVRSDAGCQETAVRQTKIQSPFHFISGRRAWLLGSVGCVYPRPLGEALVLPELLWLPEVPSRPGFLKGENP